MGYAGRTVSGSIARRHRDGHTMSKTAKKDADGDVKNVCRNRRALHEYEIHDSVECGIVLVGTEVKSLRAGHASLEDSYAKVDDGELFLIGAEIPEYAFGNRLNHKPKRERKLLLHRREIDKVLGKSSVKGFTLVPLRLYFRGGFAKVEVAVARGKQAHDKRESLKTKDAKREIDRAMSVKRKR